MLHFFSDNSGSTWHGVPQWYTKEPVVPVLLSIFLKTKTLKLSKLFLQTLMAFTSGSSLMISLSLLAEKHIKWNIYNGMNDHQFLRRVVLQKPAIDRPSSTWLSIHLLQNVSVVPMECSYFEWTLPNVLKLTMFSLLFNLGLPFQNHILDLKIFFLDLLVKCLLDSILRLLITIIDFLPLLLQSYQFIDPSLNLIWLLFQSL